MHAVLLQAQFDLIVLLVEHLKLFITYKTYINHLPYLIELLYIPQQRHSILNKWHHPQHAFKQYRNEELAISQHCLFDHCVEQSDYSP